MKVQLQLHALLGKNQPACAISQYASAISWQECILRCCHAPVQRPAPTGTRTSVDKPMAALRHSRSSVPAAAECTAGLLKRMPGMGCRKGQLSDPRVPPVVHVCS